MLARAAARARYGGPEKDALNQNLVRGVGGGRNSNPNCGVRYAKCCSGADRFLAKTVKISNFLHGSRVLSAGAPEEIRTPDPQIRSLVLNRFKLAFVASTH